MICEEAVLWRRRNQDFIKIKRLSTFINVIAMRDRTVIHVIIAVKYVIILNLCILFL